MMDSFQAQRVVICVLALAAFQFASAQDAEKDLGRLTISGPISFKAHVMQKSSLDESRFQEYVNSLVQSNKKRYDEEHLSAHAEDRQLANIRRNAATNRKPIAYDVSYACNGKQELVIQEKASSEDKVFSDPNDRVVMIYDGVKSYVIRGDGLGVSIYPGRAGLNLTWLPLPGVGLPLEPLAKPNISTPYSASAVPSGFDSCKAVSLLKSSTDTDAYGYWNGYIKIEQSGGSPKVRELMTVPKTLKLEDWSFDTHMLLGSSWVAQSVHWTEFGKTGHGDEQVPIRERSYQLTDVSGATVPATKFEVKQYARSGAEVLERLQDGKQILFKYDPTKSWEELEKGAIPIGDPVAPPTQQKVSPVMSNKVLLPFALLFAISGVIIVATRRKPRAE